MSDPIADQLAHAECALEKVLTKGAVTRVEHNGKVVVYSPANLQELKAYVAQLRGPTVTTVRFSSSKGLC